MASRCITQEISDTHTFEIAGYSSKRGIGVGRFVRSTTFTVGGFDWAIRFYPDGITETTKEFAAASLELMSSNAEARARFFLKFVMQSVPLQMLGSVAADGSAEVTGLFKSCDPADRFGRQNPRFMTRSMLERYRPLGYCYIVNDHLKIQCDLTVIRAPQLSENRVASEIEVPPCDMMEHFGNLLKEKKGVDVKFHVGGETIEAHKIVLAARSPVFSAEFLGPMRESGTCCVTIEDMQPAVFRALIHFIYNDSLPDMADLERNDYGEMMSHLLVAADRYAMDRLKLVCQSIICKNLDVETVATTLALADQHNCDKLRAACIEFMASPKRMAALSVTQGYMNLKRTCPFVFIDLFERANKLPKI